MASVQFDIGFTAERDRKTTALRFFYAIPHLIIVGALGYLAEALSVVQWFVILFTGKRHQGMWNLSRGVVDWQARAYSYAGLMFDTYPNFGFEKLNEPTTFDITFEEEANRLTCALRIIWAIPALLLLVILSIGGFVMTIVSWFAIVFTGNQSQSRFDFLMKVHRYGVRTSAYASLLTDTYPKYE